MSDRDLLQTCRACSHEFRVSQAMLGKKMPCPHCQYQVEVVNVQSAPDDRLVGRTLGGCKLVRRLGAGAIGVVYEAEQQEPSRRVAVKMLSPKMAAKPAMVTRFQREAKLCMQISHGNVVSVFDCGFDRNVHYLVMEFVDGCTLATLLDEKGPLPWKDAAVIILQVAEALAQVNGKNIIHRDIKPANILVSTTGVAKLADLGLGKNIDEATQDGNELTMQGTVLGSPAYMAPEQVRNAKDATYVADIYSLGATFYQALTGSPPFTGRNGSDVMMKVLREEPKPVHEVVPTVPIGVSTLIQRLMAKDLKKRPQSAAQVIDEIKAVLESPDKKSKAGARPSQKIIAPGTAGLAGIDTSNKILWSVAIGLLTALVAALCYVKWWM